MVVFHLWIRLVATVFIGYITQGESISITCGVEVWRKLNSNKVCLGATDGSAGSFTAMYTMNMIKIRYVRRSGYLECEPTSGGYFGCEPYPSSPSSGRSRPATQAPTAPQPTNNYHHHHYYYHPYAGYPAPQPQPYPQPIPPPQPQPMPYPGTYRRPYYGYRQSGTSYALPYYDAPVQSPGGNSQTVPHIVIHEDNGQEQENDSTTSNDHDSLPQYDANFVAGPGPASLQGITIFLTDSSNALMIPQLPHTGTYFLIAGLNRPAWNPSITIPINGAPMTINQGDILKVFFGEDFEDHDQDDNSGELCVDVYGYGTLPSPPSNH